jgi:hypothetical protein
MTFTLARARRTVSVMRRTGPNQKRKPSMAKKAAKKKTKKKKK